MISTDNIEKFNKVVAYYQLDPAQLRDVAKAVCIADYLHGTDPQKLSPARLNNSGIEVFNGVSAVKSNAKPLPDVQVMRVICDTLFYGIYIKHKKLVKGTRLTNACSSYVGTELQVNNSPVMRAETNEYFDMDECQRILNAFADSCSEVNESEFADTFEFVSKTLGRFRTLLSIIDKSHTLDESQFSSIYLPEEYDSHGYKVMNTMPRSLKTISKGALKDQVEFWELTKMMDLFVLYLAGTKSGATYRNAFINRLVKINNTMKDLVPIGIGGSTGARKDIYRPANLLNNQALNNLYDSVFSKNIALTRDSIENMFQVCIRLYSIKEEI